MTHRQSSSLLHWALSTWVSGLLPGCSGLETDLPGKTAAKSDCLSLWGGEKWDLPFITSLTLPTYGQQHTRHCEPVMWAFIQNSNRNSMLSYRLPFNRALKIRSATNRLSLMQTNRETSLIIREDQKDRAEMRFEERLMLKPFPQSWHLIWLLACIFRCVSQTLSCHQQKH